ncbi:MAG: hypothetical protein M0006_07845 [Magnetospirillum sp.]|nr:hypothetical protein [Magnetospirillum sp.]
MLRPMALLALACLATPALAQDAGTSRQVTISTSDCQALVRHVPAPGVAYQPGVDVHGNPVAPADLDSGQDGQGWQLPRTIQFPLVINPFNPQGTSNSAAARQFALTEMPIGTVTVDTVTGDVRLDGQPVTPPAAQAIADACRKRGVR